MNANQSIGGGCLCGAVSFEANLPSQWCAHCHCSMCRISHGAGFVTWVGFAESGFHVTAGEDTLRWYASSTGAERGFCSRCGSSMLFRSKRWPGEMHITLASLNGPLDRTPDTNVYYDQKVEWVATDETLRRVNPG